MSDVEGSEYQANDAGVIVDEIFSGKITVVEAIEVLRKRLLDLSPRNRLLNYRHPNGRSVQIVDEPVINLVFERLYGDGKAVPFKHVPEPDPKSYEGKRPEARLHASRIGITTSFEFSPNKTENGGRRLQGIQTLLYPADLERKLRKISSEAKTAIEETGTNMLYLIFGFLEVFDSEDSDRPMLAPLLSLPVTLVRGGIDQGTRTYQYSVMHNGEDLAENHTLREKLRKDFTLSLPEFAEEDKPEAYFERVEQAVRNKRRWKVRRQITLGMLSFGKLSIWSDLDTKKNPGLLNHDLIRSVFSGNGSEGGGLHVEDYRIDEHPEALQSLIYDADSSQHSAIIDVLSGKNMVINGPPGTGKSQTITNIIASALSKGKKVLFVSEKLAALEVVRHRLNQAGLGHFCLELHSNKTQKKKFLEDLHTRIEQMFPVPAHFDAKIKTLQRQKAELARYAELMGSQIGNSVGMTINEIFWAAEKRRQELGDLHSVVNAIRFPQASKWTHDDIQTRRSKLETLAGLYVVIRRFDNSHPWWGFRPNPLLPSDDDAIADIIRKALEHAQVADLAATAVCSYFGIEFQPTVDLAESISNKLELIPDFPDGADALLLEKMFKDDSYDPGRRSYRLISEVASDVEKARKLFESAAKFLTNQNRLPPNEIDRIKKQITRLQLNDDFLSADLCEAQERLSAFEMAVDAFATVTKDTLVPYSAACSTTAKDFLTVYEKVVALGLTQVPISMVLHRAKELLQVVFKLSSAYNHISEIAKRWELRFDASQDAVAKLYSPAGTPGLAIHTQVDQITLAEARRLAAFSLSDWTISDLGRLKESLESFILVCADSLERCRSVCQRVGVPFDASKQALAIAETLSNIATQAPADLLDYRKPAFGKPRIAELISTLESFLISEQVIRSALEGIFYIDSLPSISEIKSSVAVLRQKDGLLAYVDGNWRRARKLHAGLCKEKRKLTARKRAEELSSLSSWIESRDTFIADSEYKDCFGELFRGFETDTGKLARLNGWFLSSQESLAKHPGLSDKVNLSSIPSDRLSELAATVELVRSDAERLAAMDENIRVLFGANIAGFSEARDRSLEEGLNFLRRVAGNLEKVSAFFSKRGDKNLSPRDILRLMEARAELEASSFEFTSLKEGHKHIKEAAGDELSRVADMSDGRWSDTLPALTEAANNIIDTANQALIFAEIEAPFSFAEAFATAKAMMDRRWADITPLPHWNRFDNWAELTEKARDSTRSIGEMLELLATCGKINASVSNVLHALTDELEARSILDRLSERIDVRAMLGDRFNGVDTDLECLSKTHAWGLAVDENDLTNPIKSRMLSADAQEALKNGRGLFAQINAGYQRARAALEELSSYGFFDWDEWQTQGRSDYLAYQPSEIFQRIQEANKASGSVLPWSKYLDVRQQARHQGLIDYVDALESNRIPPNSLASAFELSVFLSIGRSIYRTYPELSSFNGVAHNKTRDDYRALDAEIISLTGRNFASQIDRSTKIPEGKRGATAGEYTEMNLLRREINKQRRHIPIRQLIKKAGCALQALKPCFMMGPLSVAQYLEQGALEFDLLVMDEASQLRPEEALGAIARGAQLVVVGDHKQLPPTSFFQRMVDGDDEDEKDETPAAISGMESILDICQQLFTPVRSLRWHYRSQHESLIAFSNHHFYKNLVVFPSPYAKKSSLGVKYRYVKGGLYRDRQNMPEAQRVVDAVLEHMIKRPNESLGVVTLNQTQRELIEDLLDRKLKTFTEGTKFLEYWAADGWPFFVKNLENVQGDERDVIFISTTFGKAPGTDKVRSNFGPISRPDGWRRLNVLFTRSKIRIELFTSMSPEDIVVDEKTPLGTKTLRDYLDFAKRGVLVTTDENEREPDSDFEVSVANIITAMGYQIKPQLGVAGFFIDIAVRNPDKPGEYLAGIECDGATYHSGASVRDRDRIRQEILESLGWKGRIHRIWSTDWFYDPRKEAERLRAFLEERRRLSAAEAPDDWVQEENYPLDDDSPQAIEANEEPEEEVAASVEGVDLFVEVGDRVTYCFVNAPNDRHSVFIVDSPSNAKMGIINEQTPVAQALLGLSPGDIGDLEVEGQKTRQLRVLKIQRQDDIPP